MKGGATLLKTSERQGMNQCHNPSLGHTVMLTVI
jgi:hypothetical protein